MKVVVAVGLAVWAVRVALFARDRRRMFAQVSEALAEAHGRR